MFVVLAQLFVKPTFITWAPVTRDTASDVSQMFWAFFPNTALAPPSPPLPQYQRPIDCSLTGIMSRHSVPTRRPWLPKPSPRLEKRASNSSVLVSGDVQPI